MLTMQRLDTPELLDEHDAPAEDVARSLRDLRRINRYLGGISIYRRLLRRLGGGAAAVLDIGAGSGDLLESLGRGFCVALDFKIDHLRHAAVRRVVGDALRLPFRDGAVDVVTSSHFFHHFTPEENARILAESLRVSRHGVAVTDTLRHVIPLLVVQLLALLRLVGRITRYDAPASVRRGYTASEAREIAAKVPAGRSEVVELFPYRFGILLWKQ
jgi:ubiquinone/menaquinone biosynthesis C-methylase UbiE